MVSFSGFCSYRAGVQIFKNCILGCVIIIVLWKEKRVCFVCSEVISVLKRHYLTYPSYHNLIGRRKEEKLGKALIGQKTFFVFRKRRKSILRKPVTFIYTRIIFIDRTNKVMSFKHSHKESSK